jgi:cysteine synthase
MLGQQAPRSAGSLIELIGHTPMMELPAASPGVGKIYAKLEMFNPTSSVKDRVGQFMIDGAERRGELRPGGTVIEASSGNTGIALAAICASRGYRCIVVLPDSATTERIRILENFGAEVVLTPAEKGYVEAIAKAEQMHLATPDSWFACQHENQDNVAAHYATTGPEIWESLAGTLDVFVCGIGTGGTITGAARYLKEQNPEIRVIGVEPERSPVVSQGWGGIHRIPGLNGGFVASTTDLSLLDSVTTVSDADAYNATRNLSRTTGLLVGISSGAAYHACQTINKIPEYRDKTIVTIFPDSGERYLSWIAEPA